MAVVLVFLGPFVGLSPAVLVHVPPGDLTNQFYPFHAYYSSEFWAGRLPLWNPYIFGGHPFLANPQIDGFYPLTVLATLIFGQAGLSLEALLWQIIGDYVLAALFTYLFIRQVTGSRVGAVVGAIMFSLGGFLTSYPMQQMSILETAIWLPLALFFIERGLTDNAKSTSSFMLAGVALAVSYLAGHPQTAMLITYAAVLYTLLRAVTERAPWKRTALGIVTLLVVALGLSAIQLLPTLEFVSLSSRTRMSFDAARQGYDFGSLVGILIPGWRDEFALYVGAVTPALIPLVALNRNRRRLVAIAVVGVLALAVAAGGNTSLYQVLYNLAPGFSLFRDQERAVFIFSLAICVAAGSGCAQLLHGDPARKSRITLATAGALIALIISSTALLIARSGLQAQVGMQSHPYERVAASYQLFAITLVLATAVVAIGASGKLGKTLPVLLLTGLVTFDVFAVNWNSNVGTDRFQIPPETASAIGFMQSQKGIYRVRIENDEVLPANYPALFGLQHVGGDAPLQVARTQELISKADEWKLWQLFNVRYVVTRRAFDQGVKPVHEAGGLRVFEVIYGLPRAYAVRKYVVARDAQEELDLTISPTTIPGDTVVLAAPPSRPPTFEVQDRPEVEILQYEPQYIRIRADGADDSILVVSETFYPGWRTYIDGVAVPTVRANYAFRGVELPRGQHIVEMVFEPSSFWLGSALSGSTLFLLIVFVASGKIRQKLASGTSQFPS